MGGRMARIAHARGAGAWLSASPRVQRVAAAQVALLLGVALTAVAVHQRPVAVTEPLALAAAVGPTSGPVAVADPTPEHNARAVSRAATAPRSRAKRKQARPKPPVDPGWAYWSGRIRGCESHGRPDAPPDYKAKNPHSSASGAYQITDATWGGRYGVSHASDATPQQQDAVAYELYGRHGTADWAASGACWRRR